MAGKTWVWGVVGGTGDWFTTNWQDIGNGFSPGTPTAGDTAYIIGGTVTVVGTDPAIDGVTLGIGLNPGQPGATTPLLQATDATFGSGVYVAAFGKATIAALGTTNFAGRLVAQYTGGTIALDVGLSNGVGVLTNTGTFSATGLSVLGVNVASGATLSNSGLITSSLLSNVDINATGGSVINASGGNITAAVYSTVNITGGTLTNAAGGTITAAGQGTAHISSDIINNGRIVVTPVVTIGNVSTAAGTMTITGSVTGTGTISDGGMLTIDGGVASGQTIDMSAGLGELILVEPGQFHGKIIGFSGVDAIDLVGVAGTSTSYSGGILTVTGPGGTVETLDFGGNTAVNAFSDGRGGTILSLLQQGTPDQVVSYITGLNKDGSPASSSFWNYAGTQAHDWGAGATITYSFGSGAGAPAFTTGEENVIQLAMSMWSAVANVTFQLVASGAELTIDRSVDGKALGGASYSTVTGNIGNSNSGTISIDTSVFPLDGFATNGYGITTALHELGHVLGLGHLGPYNDGQGTPAPVFYTDTHQYSVMSYFGVTAPTNDTIVTTINNGSSYGVFPTIYEPTTPALFDIEAMQQLYGASTNGALAGGQTFGFNAKNIGGISSFDFTQNANPVVTLFDLGTGNTLDLSGFTSTSIVNLIPGTFSSTDGMTNNIGIYYTTMIDTLIGSAGGNTVTVNSNSDTIVGSATANDTVIFAGKLSEYTFSGTANNLTVIGHGATDHLTNIETLKFSDFTKQSSEVACYLQGTQLLTPAGDKAVEELAIGDLLVTLSGVTRPIRWIGRRAYSGRFIAGNGHVLPICIRAGAIMTGVPARDLWVSPEHSLYVDEVLVQAKHLLNGVTVVQADYVDTIEYFHIELDSHDVIYADGAPAETFVDCDNRLMFGNGAEYLRLYPEDERPRWRFCAPRLEWGSRELLRIREWMFERAQASTEVASFDPRLHLEADGVAVWPEAVNSGLYRFVLPAGIRSVALRSLTHVPAEGDPAALDMRHLGVPIVRVSILSADLSLEIGHGNAMLRDGFYEDEALHRWTDGNAQIPNTLLQAFDGPAMLLVQLAPGTQVAAPDAVPRISAGTVTARRRAA